MSTYILAITPTPIDDAVYGDVFLRMSGCNPDYQGITWKGVVNFARVERYGLWTAMMQMNDQSVGDDNHLTIVWSADPFDHFLDKNHALYHAHRDTILKIVDEWTAELGATRTSGLYFDGDVSWILSGVDSSLLANDFAVAKRGQLKVLDGKV